MDFRHSEEILDGFREIIESDDFGYFDVPDEYFESILNWHKRIHNRTLKKDWIIPANGTIAALHICADALMDQDKILILTPVYGSFKRLTDTFGTRVTLALEDHKDHYELDMGKFEKSIKENAIETLLFCNPHNPSGKVWTYEELESIVKICKENKVKILSDEIHADLLRENVSFTSMIDFKDIYDEIVVSTSGNKTFNISGLNASYLITSNQSFKEKIQDTMDNYHAGINRFGMEASRIVYDEGEAWYKAILKKTEIQQQ